MHKKALIFLSLVLALVLNDTGASRAQDKFPSKPINVIVQFPPGGGTDITMRSIGAVIEKYLGQPLTIVNKPGGAGIVAGDALVRSAPDGYTIAALVATGADPELFANFRKATYALKDMDPIVRISFDPYGLVVKADAPWKTLQEFIDHVKSNPKKVSWGHQGLGHSYHLRGMSLIQENKLDMNDVAFRGSADEVTAVLGGKIDSAIVSIAASRPLIEAGTLRMLAVQHKTRLSYLPNIPTFAEQGYDVGFPLHYTGLFAPKGTPPDRIKIIDEAVKKTFEDEQFKQAMKVGGSDLLYGTVPELMGDVETMRRIYGEVFKKLGIN
jgi:tripartite-type tricarboxylate transporter receptor subunit TctC